MAHGLHGAARVIAVLVLWPLCQVDPLLEEGRIAIGRCLFRLLCGPRGTRPGGWWRTFYCANGLLLAMFTAARVLAVLVADCCAITALVLVGGRVSARRVYCKIKADLRSVTGDAHPLRNLKMAFGLDSDPT